MNNSAINWKELPDILTKEQLYKVCHISKTTARYLLQSGKIPCRYTGKKTRCYQIKKEDVIAYLEDRKIFPEAYAAPKGWYKGHYEIRLDINPPEEILSDMQEYYTEVLYQYKDVLTTLDVCKLTGYGKTTVNKWCGMGYIKSFKRNNLSHIPKIFLVEFLCSPYCRSITRKSEWHIDTLKRFSLWRVKKQINNKR